MDPKSEIVAKKIESGEYFAEAMSWFHVKFTRPRTEFSYLFIITVIAVIAALIGFEAFSEIFPLDPDVNYVTLRAVSQHEHLSIRPLEEEGDTADSAYIKFLLKEYLQAREEYDETRLDRDFRLVTTLSDDKTYNEFLNETALDNPQNPVVLYGKQASKEIIVDAVTLYDSSGKPVTDPVNFARATVNYTSYLTFANDNSQEITHHQADITFQYRQIIVDQKTGEVSQKPQLVVTGYKTKNVQ